MALTSEPNFRILTKMPEKFWKNHPNVKKSSRGAEVDSDLTNLLTSMMASNAKDRPESIEQIVSHPYF